MSRLAPACACVLLGTLVAFGADPTPVEKQLAVQTAMASARKHLEAQRPTEAVAALEDELENANGSKDFLALLREAYAAELNQLEKTPNADPARLAQTRRKLARAGGPPPKPADPPPPATAEPEVPRFVVPPKEHPLPFPINEPAERPVSKTPPPVAAPELFRPVKPPADVVPPPDEMGLARAIDSFKKGNFAQADELFAAAGTAKLTVEQKTAWAYCRIKLAADRVNAPTCDAAAAAAAAQSVADALQLITDNPKLLASGREVLKAAQAKAGGARVTTPAPLGDAIETESFRVSCGNRDLGDAVAKAAETSRKQIFERWSGPPSGAWHPKCDIVIHATADAYAMATGKPTALTGHATVRLTDGRATERRIDLRADDPAMVANALPKELTHVVLADLFADKPPPKWAEEGMAILGGSTEEIGRYTRTLGRCSREGEVRPLAALFDLKDFPADKITGFYCQSASVTEYLVKLNGERNFKIFLSDAQRYGTAQALKRQYGIDSPQALEAAWKRASLDSVRAPVP